MRDLCDASTPPRCRTRRCRTRQRRARSASRHLPRSAAVSYDAVGLIYLNNRYHNPQLGVLLSVDPLVTQTGEAYVYGGANPTTLSDPSGLCPAYVSEACRAIVSGSRDSGGSAWGVGGDPTLWLSNEEAAAKGVPPAWPAGSGSADGSPDWLGPTLTAGESVFDRLSDDYWRRVMVRFDASSTLQVYSTPSGGTLIVYEGVETVIVETSSRPASYVGLASRASKLLGALGVAVDAYDLTLALDASWDAGDSYREQVDQYDPVIVTAASIGGSAAGGTIAGVGCAGSGFLSGVAPVCAGIGAFIGGKTATAAAGTVLDIGPSGCAVYQLGCMARDLTNATEWLRLWSGS